MEKKVCFKCKKSKPLNQFYKHPQMEDGHLNKCKECAKIDVSDNYRKNKDHYREYEVKRNKTKKRKVQKFIQCKISRANNPEKRKAHGVISKALKAKKIIRPDRCAICGKKDMILHAHHEDYSKPLDVLWVCVQCHQHIHKFYKLKEQKLS